MERLYVKWRDAKAFPEGENPYVYGGNGDEVYGWAHQFVEVGGAVWAVVQPKHDLAHLTTIPINELEVIP